MLSTKVGSFSAASAAGNLAVTGVGFQPKVVFFYSVHEATEPTGHTATTQNDNAVQSLLGMYDGTTSVCAACTDNFNSGGPAIDGANCIRVTTYGPSRVDYVVASGVSLDADGFTLNFATPNGFGGTIIHYLALGGSDITGAKIISRAAPGGGTTGNYAFTGAGFKPDAAVLIGGMTGQWTNSAPGRYGMGFISSAAQRGAESSQYVGGFARYQRTDKAYLEIDNQSPINPYEADLASFDNDGLTLNFTAVTSGAVSTIYALCLKGCKVYAGAFAQKASTGTQAYTGVGFQPSALLCRTNWKQAGTAIESAEGIIGWMTGAADGTSQSVIASADTSAGNCLSDYVDKSAVYKFLSPTTGAVSVSAALSSFDADGFTLNYTAVADATARQVLYMAFGPASVSPTGPNGSAALDLFERADGALGSNWTAGVLGFADGPLTIASGKAIPGTNSANWYRSRWNPGTFGPDCEVWGVIGQLPINGHFAELELRVQSPETTGADAYELELGFTASGVDLTVYRIVNDAFTTLRTTALGFGTLAAGDAVALVSSGSGATVTLKVYKKLAGGSWTQVGTDILDANAARITAAGYLGMSFQGGTAGSWDAVGGGPLTTTTFQYQRPSADVAASGWTPQPTTPTTLYDKVDEAVDDDADYITATAT